MSTGEPVDVSEEQLYLSPRASAWYGTLIPFGLFALGVIGYLYWSNYLFDFHGVGYPLLDGLVFAVRLFVLLVVLIIYTSFILYTLTLVRHRPWKTALSAFLGGLLGLGAGLLCGTMVVGLLYLIFSSL